MAETNLTVKLILGFIAIILAVVMIGVTADITTFYWETQDIANISTNFTTARISTDVLSMNISKEYNLSGLNYPSIVKTIDCDTFNGTGLTYGTHYGLNDSNKSLYFKNASPLYSVAFLDVQNVSLCNITYLHYDYIDNQFGRVGTSLITGFFALICLAVGIAIFYSIAKDGGLFDR